MAFDFSKTSNLSWLCGRLIKSFWLQTFWCKMRTHSRERLAARRVQRGLRLAVGEFESSEWKTRHILTDSEPFRHTISKRWHTRPAPDMSIGNLLQKQIYTKGNFVDVFTMEKFPLAYQFLLQQEAVLTAPATLLHTRWSRRCREWIQPTKRATPHGAGKLTYDAIRHWTPPPNVGCCNRPTVDTP